MTITPPPSDLRTGGHHLLFLAPLAGLLVTAVAWIRRPEEDLEARKDLASAVRWQALGASVVVIHVGLQVGIEAVRWVWRSGPGLGDGLDGLMPIVLSGITWLNIGGGAAEWLFLAVWAVAASRGKPYPLALIRRLRTRPPGETRTG